MKKTNTTKADLINRINELEATQAQQQSIVLILKPINSNKPKATRTFPNPEAARLYCEEHIHLRRNTKVLNDTPYCKVVYMEVLSKERFQRRQAKQAAPVTPFN